MRRPGERQADQDYPREFSFNEASLYAGLTPYRIYRGVDAGMLGQPPAEQAAAYAQGMAPYAGDPVPAGVGARGLLWGTAGVLGVLWLLGAL